MKILIRSKYINKFVIFYLIVYVFCLIYAPRFYSFNTIHILTAIALVVFTFIFKELVAVGKTAITIKFCLFYFLIILCSTIVAALGGERLTLTNLIVVPIELCICVLQSIALLKWRKMSSMKLIDIIIIGGIIQSLICCAMVCIPELKNAINDFRAQYWDDRMIGWATVRLLGFADGLFHTTPIVQAIISILLIKKAETRPFLYLFVITTLFSALLNSRTSFVIWLLCLFCYFITSSTSIYGKRKTIVFLSFSAVLISSVILVWLNENEIGAIEYFYNGMEEIQSASQGKNVGFFGYLNQYLVFPSGVFLLFGIGCDTYGKINNPEFAYIHTDYGFVNDVWIYGIIGAIFMIYIYWKLIINCLRLKNNYNKLIFWCLLISFLIGHFKGIITYYNDYTALLLLISSSTILDTKYE